MYFEGKTVRECDAISGKLYEKKHLIWGMNEPDYVMKVMKSGGAWVSDENCEKVSGKYTHDGDEKQTQFIYKKTFDWHL